MSSSRGSIISSVIELRKDEEIYILVGQSGEHACIKSMGLPDESCTSSNVKYAEQNKISLIKQIYIDNGAGGGGGASYVFLVRNNINNLSKTNRSFSNVNCSSTK